MIYQEALNWLYTQIPNYQKIGKEAYKPGLKNIEYLMDFYGNPHQKIKTIHIAGTNGKGSTSHSLASILQEQGLKVGLFTSPHLKNFTERIRINGKECSEEFIHKQILKIQNSKFKIQPSFFELTTAFAFEYFYQEKVDIAIIEVGLGGRLDSTNIINPEICAITSISLDHQDLLGETLEEITKEKSGIIKSNIPVVIGEQNPDLIQIISEIAKKKQSKIIIPRFDFLETDLKGIYQKQNQNTVLGIINELKNLNWEVSDSSIRNGLKNVIKNTNLRGRWEVLQENPLIVCDTGHNEAGIKQIIQQLKSFNKSLRFILGFVEGKNIENILKLLPKNETYIFTQPNVKRGLNPHEYEKIIKNYNLNYRIINSILEAYNIEKQNIKETEILFIGGSTFVVSEILEKI